MAFPRTTFDETNKIWRGDRNEPLFRPDDSVGTFALRALNEDPEHIAQICVQSGKQYTNREIANMSISVAKHFTKLGFKQGDIVGICATNTDFVAPLFFGSMLSGLIIAPLDPTNDENALAYVLSITRPMLMFCDGKNFDKMQKALKAVNLNIRTYTMKDHRDDVTTIFEFLEESNKDHRDFRASPLKLGVQQIAAILQSSGTAGLPKSVCITHEGLMRGYKGPTPIPIERFIIFSTLHWTSGTTFLLYSTLMNWTRIVTDQEHSPKHFFELVQEYKINFVFGMPSLLAFCVASPDIGNYDLSSIMVYVSGGGPLPPPIINMIEKHLPNAMIFNAYGMTETNGVIAAIGPTNGRGAVGQLEANVEIKIVDSQGRKLGPGEVGEICIRFPHYWPGYYKNLEATNSIRDAENFLHSADLGYIDEDGDLFVVDRIKDIYKNAVHTFQPTEIEFIIHELDDVVDACVVALLDPVSINVPAAAVILKPNSKLTPKDITDYVAKKTPSYKQLKGGVFIVESLPKTSSGKVKRHEVIIMCEKTKNFNSKL